MTRRPRWLSLALLAVAMLLPARAWATFAGFDEPSSRSLPRLSLMPPADETAESEAPAFAPVPHLRLKMGLGVTYDPVGNRTTQTTSGVSQTYGYDNRDRITTDGNATYTFDTNGNLTTKSGEATYTWDFENRLIRVQKTDGTVVSHVYDADGNRVQTVTSLFGQPATTVNYLVDTSGGLSQVVAETDAAGTVQAYYVRGDDLLSVIQSAGSLSKHAKACRAGSRRQGSQRPARMAE